MEFTIFTTRADTMFGVTFMVLAPESELVQQLTTDTQKDEVNAYLERTKNVLNANVLPIVALPVYSLEAMLSTPLPVRQYPSG